MLHNCRVKENTFKTRRRRNTANIQECGTVLSTDELLPTFRQIIGQLQERFSENDIDTVQNVEKLLLADSRGDSQAILEHIARFYELDQDNLKAELRVFGNLVKEIEREEAIDTLPEQGDDKRYKILCRRRAIFAEDRGIQTVLPLLCKLTKIFGLYQLHHVQQNDHSPVCDI